MVDGSWRQRLIKADRDLAEAKQKVDAQLEVIRRLEALDRDDVKAQQKLEALLETLEEAQQQRKALRNTIK
jgi:hypothetical protein